MRDALLILLGGMFVFCIVLCKMAEPYILSKVYKTNKKITPLYKVLIVKNNEDCIEGVINSIIKEMRIEEQLDFATNIILIDLGSKDDTLKIANQLRKKYDFLHIIKNCVYIDIAND